MKKEAIWSTREVATLFGEWVSHDIGKPNPYGSYGKFGSGYEMTIDQLYEVFLLNNGIDPEKTTDAPIRSFSRRILLSC